MGKAESTSYGEGGWRRVTAWLILLLFAARALVPAGFMPTVSAANGGVGELTLVLCTQSGPVTVKVGDDGVPTERAPAPADTDTALVATCFFALSALALVPSPPTLFHRDPPFAIERAGLIAELWNLPGQATGPPLGSRAPPFFV